MEQNPSEQCAVLFETIGTARREQVPMAEVAGAVLDFALRLSNWPRGVVLAKGPEQRPAVIAHRNMAPDYLQFLRSTYSTLPGFQSAKGEAAKHVSDVAMDADYVQVRDFLVASGIRSLCLLPMRGTGDELVGALVLYHEVPQRPFEPTTLMLFAGVTDYLAVTMVNEQLRRSRDLLLRHTLLEKSQEVVGVFLAGIAHDFNNLLGGLLGLVSLAPSLKAKDLANLCERLRSPIEQTSALTRSLLQLSGSVQPEEEQLAELTAVVADAVTIVRPTLDDGTVLTVEAHSRELWAQINSMAFSRVILNLLLNAIQALAGRGGARIVVRFGRASGQCWVEVDDNGPGVAPENMERIFEPFVSIHKGGTGVGLAAARAIAEKAGGSLTVKDRPGPGACFVVSLKCVGSSEGRSSGSPVS